ncbi:MAG TPA: hypothetical protein VHM19_15895 [Polyangiales bacterium]|nr:hypothetical protein [Polyangiales bacterium]
MLGLSSLCAVAHAARSLSTARGFAPLLALWGGDEARALPELRNQLDLLRVVLEHTEVDATLARLQRKAFDSLADFDLQQLHALLPEQNGAFRELRALGQREGERYAVRAARRGEAFEISVTGPRRKLGDASFVLRAKPVPAGDDLHYLLEGRAGIAVGGMTWPHLLLAQRTWWQLVTGPTPVASTASTAERPMLALRQAVLSANPGLDARETETLAVLWEAFLRTGYVLQRAVRVEDLIADAAGGSATHVHASLVLVPERMRERYPALAEYLSDLDQLAALELRVADERGRTLVQCHLDTRRLRMQLSAYVVEGHLVPFDAAHVYSDAPVDLATGATRFTVHADGDFHVLGVRAHMTDAMGTLRYAPTASGMRVDASVTHVPTIRIGGAALGFVPTELIDAVMPGDLQSLAEKLVATACHGNDKRGITMQLQLDQGTESDSVVSARGALEAPDNFLIRMGVQYWNDHLRPDPAVSTDVSRLLRDAQAALSADVERYARSGPQAR